MATHSSILAWRIPGMAEPGGMLSMGSQSWTQLKRLSSSDESNLIFLKMLFISHTETGAMNCTVLLDNHRHSSFK